MSLFHRIISFPTIDPLGDGLAEEIIAEQQEPEAMNLDADIDERQLDAYWQYVIDDNEKSLAQTQSIDE